MYRENLGVLVLVPNEFLEWGFKKKGSCVYGAVRQIKHVEILEKFHVGFNRLLRGVLRVLVSPDAVTGTAAKCREDE